MVDENTREEIRAFRELFLTEKQRAEKLKKRNQEMKDKLETMRRKVWGMDIPNPTTPEYEELHQKIQSILWEIDQIIY